MGVVRVLFVALAIVAGSMVVLPTAPTSRAGSGLPGSVYTALPSPARILDTRTDVGGHRGQVSPGETVTLAVPALPPTATAVVINLTGIGGAASTYLSTFPNQFTGTSTLNLAPGQTAAVAAFVTLGRNQSINIFNHRGSVDVIVDLHGYFATDTGSSFVSAPSPTRILDTRTSLGGHAAPLAPGEVLTLPVRGVGGVPADASAVVVNVTGVLPTANTYLAITPDGGAGTSTLNLDRDAIRANLAVVGVGQDGAVRIRNNAGSAHVVADVQGWFVPGGGGRYVSLPAPRRVLDTREYDRPLEAGADTAVPFADSGVPAQGRIAVLFNLTGVGATANTYLTAWPGNQPRPLASNVNVPVGSIVPNLAITDTSTPRVYNHVGTTSIVVDAAGYFYTPTRTNPTLPGAPTVTAASAAGDRVRVAWSAADDGGLPLVGYTVTAQPGGLSVTVDGSRQEVRLGGLNPGVSYTVTVTAANLIGAGPESGPSGPVSPSSMTRLDTDAAGAPDQIGADFQQLSGNGRHALLWVRSDSNLMPAEYRTPDDQGRYLVRKDVQTGAITLAGITESGRPLRSNWPSAISQDGTLLAYSSSVDDGPSVLYVRDLAAHIVRPVVTSPAGTAASQLALSDDGRWLTWVGSLDNQAGSRVYRHDRQTQQTTTVLACDNPSAGCYLYNGPVVSGDGMKLLFAYRPTPADPIRLTLLDSYTGTMHALPEGGQGDGYAISGDGNWILYAIGQGCPSCGGGTFQLKKVAAHPGAVPIELRSWQDSVTWGVHPSSATTDGSLVGYFRQTGESGQWFGAAPGYVYDQQTQREIRMPDARDTAYAGAPAISADGRMAVLEERCLWATACYPTGTYVVSLTELR